MRVSLSAGLAILIAASTVFGAAVTVNGVCYVGNCASPDLVSSANSPSTAFNFVITLPNTDQCRIAGSVNPSTGASTVGIISPFTVSYLGNANGTASGADVITLDVLQKGHLINLYGRSIGAAFPHRLLPRSKGGLFAWDSVGVFSSVILVEGLFDLAVLWQAGLRNTTCAFGTHLTAVQWSQLCDQPGRCVYIAFDRDVNQAGQRASGLLARRLENAGLQARIVALPAGRDPNGYFVAGATASDFVACMEHAQSV